MRHSCWMWKKEWEMTSTVCVPYFVLSESVFSFLLLPRNFGNSWRRLETSKKYVKWKPRGAGAAKQEIWQSHICSERNTWNGTRGYEKRASFSSRIYFKIWISVTLRMKPWYFVRDVSFWMKPLLRTENDVTLISLHGRLSYLDGCSNSP